MSEFQSKFYRLCEDNDCEFNYAYRFDGSSTHHFHYIGSKALPDDYNKRDNLNEVPES